MSGASISGGSSGTYTLDGAGNRSSLAVSGVGTTSYGYDSSDELTSVTPPGLGAVSNTFDANGNQTGRGSDTFTWDAQNRMTAATVGGISYTMTYNGDGLRQTRTSGGTTTSFTWDAARGLPTILDDGTQYVYGAGIGPLEHVTTGGTSYYLPDALGSTLAMVSGSGSVTKTYTYDPFGAVTASTGTGTDEYQFAGQETDPTGVQYLRSRYYDPGTGRFLGRDTFPSQLAQPQSVNRYPYGSSDPISLTDPSGHDWWNPFTWGNNPSEAQKAIGQCSGQGLIWGAGGAVLGAGLGGLIGEASGVTSCLWGYYGIGGSYS